MRANEGTLLLGRGEVGRATNMIAHNASGRRRDTPASKSVDDYVRDQPKALVKVDSSVFPRRLRREKDLRNRVQYIAPSNLTSFSNVYSL